MSKPATTVDLAAFKKHLADSLERNAKSAGQTIVKETLTCEMGIGSQVVIAALKREQLPTEKEITAGVDLFFGYVSTNGQRALPPGYYRIRLALPGYEKSGAVKVSFIDAAEKYLRKAVEIAPRDRAANYYLGKHLLHWDRKKEARTFLSKAARLGDSRARKLLSDVC